MINQGQGLIERIVDTIKTQDLIRIRQFLGNLNFEKLLETLQAGLISGLGIIQTIFSSVFTLSFLLLLVSTC